MFAKGIPKMPKLNHLSLAIALLAIACLQAQQPTRDMQTLQQRTTGMQKIDGYFPLYWDERSGNLFLEISRFDAPFLYTTGLAAGLGSNDIGLDRGQGGLSRIVSFQRIGPRVLLVQSNE